MLTCVARVLSLYQEIFLGVAEATRGDWRQVVLDDWMHHLATLCSRIRHVGTIVDCVHALRLEDTLADPYPLS